MEEPLISVIIPTHNRPNFLKKAISSVLSQNYKNLEVIIIDDCSFDNTSSVVLEFQKKDSRIVFLKNEKNLGFVKTLNKAIALSKGEYIARLDDDDFWVSKEKIKKQLDFLENNKDYVLVGGGAIIINANGKEISKIFPVEKDSKIRKNILKDNCFVHSSVLFRKKDWERAGGYNENFGTSCDWGLWLELGKIGKFYNFQEYFVYYLKWDKNISAIYLKDNLKKEIKMRHFYRNDYPGYFSAFILGQIYYISYFLPFRQNLRYFLIKIKKIIFGALPYNKNEN